MTTRARLLTAALSVLAPLCAGARAQTAPPANANPLTKEQAAVPNP